MKSYFINIVSLFPELVRPAHEHGVIGRAARAGLVRVSHTNPREFTADTHRTIDDRPYGGGPGMVMMYEPLKRAIQSAKETMPSGSPTILLSAQGKQFDQGRAEQLAQAPGLILVAGRYEGVDERVADALVDEELSIGDFVLSGGEIGACVILDAVVRLLPGVLGHGESAQQDSFSGGLLDYPQYTRPEQADGMRVPSVLMGGDHGAIARWRLKEALGRTWLRRPDLLSGRQLTAEEQALLDEFRRERNSERREAV